jgi:hypothetical protein
MNRKTLTHRRALAIAAAIQEMEPWALIGRFLQDDRWGHTTDQDLEELARALCANYPRFISPADVRNAWDWFRIYGEADWAAKAVVAKRDLADLDSDEFWYRQDWQQARARLDDALFEVVSPCLPEWPFEPLPERVLEAFLQLPARRFLFVNRVPPASERAREKMRAHG